MEAAKTFEDLSNETEENFRYSLEQVGMVIGELANGLREQASQGGDLPVAPDQEKAKREAIKLWRESAAHMDLVRHALATVPVSGETLRDEIAKILISGFELWVSDPIDKRSTITELMQERAANLAQAYAGRILPEQTK